MEYTKFMFLTNQLPKFCTGGENLDTKLQVFAASEDLPSQCLPQHALYSKLQI